MVTIEVRAIDSRLYGKLSAVNQANISRLLSCDIQGGYLEKESKFGRKEDRIFIPTEETITLFDPDTWEFPTGLLSRVCDFFTKIGEDYRILDRRVQLDPDHVMPLALESTMRTYQQEAIDIAVRQKCGIIRAATGAGKTRMMAGIVAALERRAVILVHRLDLMYQVLGVLQGLMLFPEIIGRVGQGVYEPNVITVMTVQTACAALGINYEKTAEDDDESEVLSGAKAFRADIEKTLKETQVVVVDEVHHCPARTISEVLKRCVGTTWRIGLSATDWRDDGLDLLIEAAFGPRIFDVSLSDLVDLGYLVPARVTMYPQAFEGKILKFSRFLPVYKKHYVENDLFHEQVLEVNKRWHREGRTILTLVKMIAHGKSLEYIHNEAGIHTVFLHGKIKTADRKSTLDAMRDGRLRHIIGTSIADEGLDIPILDAINLAGGGGSTTQAYQRIGRAVRVFGNKKYALVADYRPSHPMLERHALTRARIYKKERCFEYREVK